MPEAAGLVGITEVVEDELEADTEAVFEAEVVEDKSKDSIIAYGLQNTHFTYCTTKSCWLAA